MGAGIATNTLEYTAPKTLDWSEFIAGVEDDKKTRREKQGLYRATPIELPGIFTRVESDSDIVGYRFGTPVVKGIEVTEAMMIDWEKALQEKFTFYSTYPDLFVDEVLTPTDSIFKLTFSQRIFLRTMVRVPATHITASRGMSKTFLELFAFILKAIFEPRSIIALAAPSKTQAAEIGKDKMQELLLRFPLLKNELIDGRGRYGKDYAVLLFKNGSRIEVTAALETTRGKRYSALGIDELRDQDGEAVNAILLPTLVISRRTAKGILNQNEPHGTRIFTSSASSKSSYNYEVLKELFMMSILNPKIAMVYGVDYRVPVKEGLMSLDYINQLKLSANFNEAAFAREFLSIYTGETDDSWFSFKQLDSKRRIVNAEWTAKNIRDDSTFYLISVDVGRITDSTEVMVFKVLPRKDGSFRSVVVNIITLGRTKATKHFAVQARDLKEIIRAFNPREVVIDTNGLGVSIADELIRTHVSKDGTDLPPLGFFNDPSYAEIQPQNAPKILYSLKATQTMNSDMYKNTYARINSGLVDFLITEQEARKKLLAMKKGQKMSLEKRIKRLLPYEMTTRLFEQMGNMRLKNAGINISLERINSRFPKDKFSALYMGLWRIKALEEEQLGLRNRARREEIRTLIFFTPGGGE